MQANASRPKLAMTASTARRPPMNRAPPCSARPVNRSGSGAGKPSGRTSSTLLVPLMALQLGFGCTSEGGSALASAPVMTHCSHTRAIPGHRTTSQFDFLPKGKCIPEGKLSHREPIPDHEPIENAEILPDQQGSPPRPAVNKWRDGGQTELPCSPVHCPIWSGRPDRSAVAPQVLGTPIEKLLWIRSPGGRKTMPG